MDHDRVNQFLQLYVGDLLFVECESVQSVTKTNQKRKDNTEWVVDNAFKAIRW